MYILQYGLICVIGGVEERRRILTERSWAKSARPTLLIQLCVDYLCDLGKVPLPLGTPTSSSLTLLPT